MSVLTFWALVGASGATVLALYLRRPRPRVVVVPFVGWFGGARGVGAESRRALLLRRPLSLLLQLVLLGLLAFLGKRLLPTNELGTERVVLVETTGPLEAVDSEGRTLGARLEAGFGALLERFSAKDSVTVVELAETPRVLVRGRADERALREFPWPREAAPGPPAVEEALALLSGLGGPKAEVVLLRSTREGLELESLRARGVREFPLPFEGASRSSLRIASFGARRVPQDPSTVDVVVALEGEPGEAREVSLEIAAADVPSRLPRSLVAERRSVRLPAELFFEGLLVSESALVLRLASSEPSSAKARGVVETAFATVAELPPVHVFVRGPASTFLTAALLQDSRLVRVEEPERADLEIVTIEDGRSSEGRLPTLYLGASGPRRSKPIQSFGFDSWDREHPILASLDPYEIQVLRGGVLATESEDRVLARSAGRPILVAGRRRELDFVQLGFVPEDSDFVLRPAYPLFVHNALLFLAGRSLGSPSPTAPAGQPLRIGFAPERSGPVRLYGPWPGERAREEVRAASDGPFLFVPEREGLYTITRGGESKLVAVGRRPEPAPGTDAGSEALEVFEGAARPWAPPWLALAGILLFFGSSLEWLGYHRRWTS